MSRKNQVIHFSMFLLLMLTMISCGESDNGLDMTNSVSATLTGRVYSYPDNTFLEGATYSIPQTTHSGTTDSSGTFSIDGLQPGSYQLEVSASDHATTLVDVVVSAGDVETQPDALHVHRDIYLIEATATVDASVYRSPDGLSVSDVSFDLVSCSFPENVEGHQIDLSSVSIQELTDAEGHAVLSGIPLSAIVLSASGPVDSTDLQPSVLTIDISKKEQQKITFVMRPVNDAVELIDSNITNKSDNYSTIRCSDKTIYFIFSTIMNTDNSTSISLQKNSVNANDIPVAYEWVSPVCLQVTSKNELTDYDTRYKLLVTAQSQNNSLFQQNFNIYWVSMDVIEPGDCEDKISDLRLSEEYSKIDYDTNDIHLSWTAVPCANGYRIYAMDDYNNPEWQYIKSESYDFEGGTAETVLTLPDSFDRYMADNVMTPFAKTTVSFCVVPVNSTIPEPGGDHYVLLVSDNTPPEIENLVVHGTKNNTSDSETWLEIIVQFSELIDYDTPDPVIFFQESGGYSDFVINPESGSWKWQDGRKKGVFTFPLEPNQNALEDLFQVKIENMRDRSGNVALTPYKTVYNVIYPDVFNFEGSMQGWSRTGDGWELGTPTIGPEGAYNGQSCWGTSLNSNYGINWNTTLKSPPLELPSLNPYLRFFHWYSLDSYDDICELYLVDETGTDHLLLTTSSSSNWRERIIDLKSFSGQIVTFEFRFKSDANNYSNYYGYFMDNFEIYEKE